MQGKSGKITVETLLSSQEGTAAVVLVVNRSLCPAIPPLGLHVCSLLFVLPKSRSGQRSAILCMARGMVDPLADHPVGVLSISSPAPPCCPAVCRPAPNRPWYVWVLDSSSFEKIVYDLLGPKPGHTMDGSGRGGARPVYRRPIVPIHPFHAMHIRKQMLFWAQDSALLPPSLAMLQPASPRPASPPAPRRPPPRLAMHRLASPRLWDVQVLVSTGGSGTTFPSLCNGGIL